MKNSKLSLLIVGAVALVSCGDTAPAAVEFDEDRACRVGQRLIEEIAEADRAGAIKQIERLDDVDGIEGSPLDVDELDEIAEGLDQTAINDLIDEFDRVDCELEPVSVAADPDPESEITPPDNTDTDSVPTDIATTDPEPSDTKPALPPGGTSEGVSIDVGSTGPGDAIGLDRPTEDLIADFGIAGIFFSPNTNVVEFSLDRTDVSYDSDPEWSETASITMSAATDTTLDDIRTAYRAAIEATGLDYEFTESTSSSGDERSVGLEASPVDFDLSTPRWGIEVNQSDETPGVVLIEVDRTTYASGSLPDIPAATPPDVLANTSIGDALGWTLASYRMSESINSFSGGTYTYATLRWDVSEDDTLVATADALKAVLGGGPFENEEVDSDSISFFLPTDESPLWSVYYDDFSGTTVYFSL